MRYLVILLALISVEASASKRLNQRQPYSYYQSFGVGSTQSVTYTGTQGSVVIQSSGGEATELVRIFTTTAAFIDIGTTSAATIDDMPLAANGELIIELTNNEHISAVQATAGGSLYVTHLPFFRNQ